MFSFYSDSVAKDLFHEAVKVALIKDGWTITDDPYSLRLAKRRFNIDLGAEKVLAAQRDKQIIAVEIKSFLSPSPIYDFHQAVGQYINYFNLIRRNEPQTLCCNTHRNLSLISK